MCIVHVYNLCIVYVYNCVFMRSRRRISTLLDNKVQTISLCIFEFLLSFIES